MLRRYAGTMPIEPDPDLDHGDGHSESGHSTASITRHALEFTREVGLDGITIRALARRAGVFPTVVYHHVGDLETVRYAVADAVVAAIEIPPPIDDSSEWRSWLSALAENGYATLSAYQGVYPFITRTGPSSPSQLRVIDAAMQVLAGAGLSDRDATFGYNAFIAHVGASADTAARFALHADERPARRAEFERRVRDVAALHPGLARTIPFFSEWDHTEGFRVTLELLLDGIERRRVPPSDRAASSTTG